MLPTSKTVPGRGGTRAKEREMCAASVVSSSMSTRSLASLLSPTQSRRMPTTDLKYLPRYSPAHPAFVCQGELCRQSTGKGAGHGHGLRRVRHSFYRRSNHSRTRRVGQLAFRNCNGLTRIVWEMSGPRHCGFDRFAEVQRGSPYSEVIPSGGNSSSLWLRSCTRLGCVVV
jgi:hypothetical protein